jgi:hypothetical protein
MKSLRVAFVSGPHPSRCQGLILSQKHNILFIVYFSFLLSILKCQMMDQVHEAITVKSACTLFEWIVRIGIHLVCNTV